MASLVEESEAKKRGSYKKAVVR